MILTCEVSQLFKIAEDIHSYIPIGIITVFLTGLFTPGQNIVRVIHRYSSIDIKFIGMNERAREKNYDITHVMRGTPTSNS